MFSFPTCRTTFGCIEFHLPGFRPLLNFV
uniref:Uncharacterized protein n=1 Tax=Anguilla anguilla TaxID=7936 RepID=A0A0E9V6W9_ANGAN